MTCLVKRTFEDDGGGASCSGISKRAKTSDADESMAVEDMEDCDKTITNNMPMMTTVYRCPTTQEEWVGLMVSLPGGAENVEFSLVGSGAGSRLARITFSWPPLMYNIDDAMGVNGDQFSLKELARSMAFKQELHNHRDSIDAKPQGTIDISLPVPVLTSIDSYTFNGKRKPDGSLVLVADLKAYQDSYTIPHEKRKVDFV